MKERFMIFGTAFFFSCLAIMFFLHFRRVRSGNDSLIRRWVNAAGETGPIEQWLDADTLVVQLPKETVAVHLNAVDSPSGNQLGAKEALAFAQNVAGGTPVRVLEFRRNEIGEIIGEVYNSENLSLNEELMKAGWAWFYEPDSPNNPYYRELNDKAIHQRLGLWSLGIPTPPWETKSSADPQ